MKVRKMTVALAATVAAGIMTIPAPAQAADASIWSTTWKSSARYDDSANRLQLCDIRLNDGDGAYMSVWYYATNRPPVFADHVYNGCKNLPNVPDGIRMVVTVCDWTHINSNRNPYYCANMDVTT